MIIKVKEYLKKMKATNHNFVLFRNEESESYIKVGEFNKQYGNELIDFMSGKFIEKPTRLILCTQHLKYVD